MNNDYLDVDNSIGMPSLADSAFALDFLLSVKNGVRNCAFALTEAASPDVRTALHRQLNNGLDLHREVSQLMMKKGWLHPYQVQEQFQLDLQSTQTAANIGGLSLFPKDTDRLGTFATPFKSDKEEM